LHTAVS